MMKIFGLILLSLSILSCSKNKTPQPTVTFVDLEQIDGVFLDIRYATANNFTQQVIYPDAKAFLVKQAGDAIIQIAKELQEKGLGLKIYDAYRPLSAQRKLWEVYPNPEFVADPKTGSRHNRGAAVDLTLTDLQGNELPMPTTYDEFLPQASHSYTELSDTVLTNRALLKETMMKYGFEPLESEWWHYDYKNWQEYPVLDIDFMEITQK
ncbi:D-alanyl-D-alanine dipeptidase [bacterium]|nr:MAG: D-alanyl-D-alanine dipeptidase [bacterium]